NRAGAAGRRADIGRAVDRRAAGPGRRAGGGAGPRGHSGGRGDRPRGRGLRGTDLRHVARAMHAIPEYTSLTPDALDALERAVRERRRVALRSEERRVGKGWRSWWWRARWSRKEGRAL